MSKFEVAPRSRRREISCEGRLLERGPSKYRSVRLHCGVKRSLHAQFVAIGLEVLAWWMLQTDKQIRLLLIVTHCHYLGMAEGVNT